MNITHILFLGNPICSNVSSDDRFRIIVFSSSFLEPRGGSFVTLAAMLPNTTPPLTNADI